MINLKDFARNSFETATRRRKTTSKISHNLDACSLLEEIDEFQMSSEEKVSVHIPPYTEAQEELADILIASLTELYKRGVDVEAIIMRKAAYNEIR